MAFPTAPANNEIHIGSSGMNYVYTTATKSWKPVYQPQSKDNVTATIPPTATDDQNAGYKIGSTWLDLVANMVWVCTSNIANAATWQPLTIKNNTATIPPTISDDHSAGYSVSSTWYDSTNKITYICVKSTIANAVWEIASITNATAHAQLPLLTAIPTISMPITFPIVSTTGLPYNAGVFTATTAGTYTLQYTANFEATKAGKGYFANVFINNVIDPVAGVTVTDKNITATRWPRIVTVTKTLQLAANDTITVNHFTDDVLATVSADILIRRIA